jgi:hypothetical protein
MITSFSFNNHYIKQSEAIMAATGYSLKPLMEQPVHNFLISSLESIEFTLDRIFSSEILMEEALLNFQCNILNLHSRFTEHVDSLNRLFPGFSELAELLQIGESLSFLSQAVDQYLANQQPSSSDSAESRNSAENNTALMEKIQLQLTMLITEAYFFNFLESLYHSQNFTKKQLNAMITNSLINPKNDRILTSFFNLSNDTLSSLRTNIIPTQIDCHNNTFIDIAKKKTNASALEPTSAELNNYTAVIQTFFRFITKNGEEPNFMEARAIFFIVKLFGELTPLTDKNKQFLLDSEENLFHLADINTTLRLIDIYKDQYNSQREEEQRQENRLTMGCSR